MTIGNMVCPTCKGNGVIKVSGPDQPAVTVETEKERVCRLTKIHEYCSSCDGIHDSATTYIPRARSGK